MFDVSLHTLVSLIALGMALAFITADAQSRTSQALSLSLGSTGVAIFLNVSLIDLAETVPAWSGWLAIPESIGLIAMLEWLLRVRRTLPAAAGMNTRTGDRILRFGQLCAAAYSVISIAAPDLRVEHFIRAATRPDSMENWRFWLFAGPIDMSALCGFAAILLLLNRKPDRAEKIRVLAMAAAVPFFLAGFVLPRDMAALSCVIGEILLLIGSMRYYVEQGQRGQFMARFLSRDVAKLVSDRGLATAMQENQLEITVVSCDLRGFTPYAAAAPSREVLQVLRDYYDAVGEVVGRYGATIKDYAGDGILILVGAPIAMPDHAARGIAMARQIRSTGIELTQRWNKGGSRLGIGIGVASGPVTVGVIGSATLEYTAVGSAVNLASRLCEQAVHGEILIDARTRQLAPADALEPRQPLQVKGFAEPVPLFAAPA
ncbi:MAG: adenylate/guanylate cyclase protein [Panacagrimonas sp.]|jgi:class 3 adenylate cyclase|nr:adenylate/guanylate cyclase domain-containing protein [Panacagrimonas sp.]MCC2655430.1 adenylate/guanylate cyclase protein [Panacagrimonas sp.]